MPIYLFIYFYLLLHCKTDNSLMYGKCSGKSSPNLYFVKDKNIRGNAVYRRHYVSKK